MVETHVIRPTGRGSLAAPLQPHTHARMRRDLRSYSMCQQIAARPERSPPAADGRFRITVDDNLNNLRPEDIEFISPDTIYKE